jgi:hypothetical protein
VGSRQAGTQQQQVCHHLRYGGRVTILSIKGGGEGDTIMREKPEDSLIVPLEDDWDDEPTLAFINSVKLLEYPALCELLRRTNRECQILQKERERRMQR